MEGSERNMDWSKNAERRATLARYLIGKTQLKYETLDELVAKYKVKLHPNKPIVVHIDLEQIMHRLYRSDTYSSLLAAEPRMIVQDITIGIMNVIAHYRHYCASRLHLDNTILLYWNTQPSPIHCSIYPIYQFDTYQRYDLRHREYGPLTKMVQEAISMIQNLVQYISGVYWVDNHDLDTVMCMYHTIHRKSYRDAQHLIMTRNLIAGQMVSDTVTQFLQYRNPDRCRFLTPKNLYQDGVLYGSKHRDKGDGLTPYDIATVYALAPCPEVNMKQTTLKSRVPDVIKLLQACHEHGLPEEYSFQRFLSVWKEVEPKKAERIADREEELIRRYRITDLSSCSKYITKPKKTQLYRQFYDLYDQNSLEELNELLASSLQNPNLLNLTQLNEANGLRFTGYEEPFSMESFTFDQLDMM